MEEGKKDQMEPRYEDTRDEKFVVGYLEILISNFEIYIM